ncbi:hypothetical protein [Parendozoicomonas haliclonae]|nr:hypothetical protein [Parendozoicomonas haliclonae]
MNSIRVSAAADSSSVKITLGHTRNNAEREMSDKHCYQITHNDDPQKSEFDNYSLWDNYRFLIPFLSGLAFQAMPHYRDSLFNAPFIHGLISGIGSHTLYFGRDSYYPERFLRRAPPDSEMDIIIPLISYGYAGYELFHYLTSTPARPDFIFHSAAMTAVFSIFAGLGELHLLSDVLVIELSSIFLGLKDYHDIFAMAFAGTFYIYRWGLFPQGWWTIAQAPETGEELEYPERKWRRRALVAAGAAFNALSGYWGILTLGKILDKYVYHRP